MARAELTAALALDRRLRRRAAAEVVPVAEGLVVRHPELYDVHYVNAVLVDAGSAASPGDLVALADRWLGDLPHRHVVLDDETAGEGAAAALVGSGWERRRTLYMTFAGDPQAAGGDPRARRIAESEMEALQVAAVREEVSPAALHSGLVARLVATQRTLRATTPARCFGAGEGGGLQSMCTLFLDDDLAGGRAALVAEVGTLHSHRGRGLARAAVGAAVAGAAAWGARLIVVSADADDWPQLLYASLGFAPAGRQVSLTRRRSSAGTGL